MMASRRRSHGQRGVSLLEFVLVLPLLLAIAVGIVYYGYAFVLQSAVAHAAKAGAQTAIAVSPLGEMGDDYPARRETQVRRAVTQSLSWLPHARDGMLTIDHAGPGADACVAGGGYPVIVALRLPRGPGAILLPLPEQVRSVACASV